MSKSPARKRPRQDVPATVPASPPEIGATNLQHLQRFITKLTLMLRVKVKSNIITTQTQEWMFNVIFIDAEGQEDDSVVMLKNFLITKANSKYNNTGCDLELCFTDDTTVEDVTSTNPDFAPFSH
ncbi:hypothetical protein TKK_0014702 [Trichogramma kaykai]|uniref:Uncharacterized protein n=1 Tax=Trichogramma kaykai TaxID=54128 RepID=A0ABD2WDW5_9HYME